MGSAGPVVQEYIATHAERLLAAVPRVGGGDDDAVHDARVATRRLRVALWVARPLLDRTVTDPLRDELAELGRVLGGVRDPFVERRALARMLAHEDPSLVVGPIQQRLDEDRAAARQSGLAEAEDWLASERVAALAAALTTDLRVGDASDDVLRERARSAWNRLDRAVAAAARAPRGEEYDDALHEVRKAARHARYASEVAVAAVGRPARRSARRAHRVQEALGAQHDAVVRQETLRRLAHQAELDGESTFTYGRLHALEQVAGDAAEASAGRPLRRAARRGHRRWMR